jgi:membrane associated rhomboid family serine protease
MFRTLPPVIKGILIAFGAVFVLSIVMPSLLYSLLPLFPQLVVHNFQLWRLVTYPFYCINPGADIISTLFRLVWIGFILVFFGGELEAIIHTKRFGMALGATILLGGIIFTFLSPEGMLLGPHLITMFVLAGFAYMWPNRPVSIYGIFHIKARIIAAVVFFLVIIPLHGFNIDTSATNVFAPMFGALSALVFFHVTYRQYSFGRSILTKIGEKTARKPQPTFDPSNPFSVQRRIDAILDKISVSGMNSLSKEEREILLKHTKS